MEITRVDYIRVPVDDIEAAKQFYGDTLGLPRNEHLDHDDWIEYEAANVTLAVMTPETHDDVFAVFPAGTIALGVPDVGRARGAGPRSGRDVGFRRVSWGWRQRSGREPDPPPPQVPVV